MALSYHTEGATSFSALNWSDATGFANGSTNVIERGGQTITTSLDQSALTGIESLEVRRTFTGSIGSPSAGPLKIDADASGTAHIYYAAGGGEFYLQAGGGSALITSFEVNGNCKAVLVGGTFTTVNVTTGILTANGSTVITSMYVHGGTVTIEDNATALTNLYIFGGNVTLKRAVTNFMMQGASILVWDADGRSLGTTTFDALGGTIVWKAGDIPGGSSVSRCACTFDVSDVRRSSTFAGTNATTVYPKARGVYSRSAGATITWTTANIILQGTSFATDSPAGGNG